MSTTIKAKHQRLVLILLALIALIGAALLGAWALRNQASYFYVPSDIMTDRPAPDQAIRLGGMVEDGSIVTAADGVTVSFIVSDGDARIPVTYTGILPDLFVEASGVVAEGSLNADGVFMASNLLAKHDENYIPVELEGIDMTGSQEQMIETLQ